MTRLAPDLLARVAVSLRVDAVAAEVAVAFGAARVDWRLLKGPALKQALYPGGERTYRDLDVLVAPHDEARCYDALRAAGFTAVPGFGERERIAYEHEWRRGADQVDVHVTLVGAAAPAERVWSSLTQETATIDVAGNPVPVLGPAAMALHVALHAAQHGATAGTWAEDLDRAIVALPAATWSAAARLAREIDAEAAFAAGLRLARRSPPVEIPRLATPAEVELRAGGAPPLAHGFDRLRRDVGWKPRLRRVGRALIPTPQFMRRWSRLARHGALGLALAYPWRVAWLLYAAPRAALAYARVVLRQRRDDAAPGAR
jgi:hypothetical protein